MQVNSRKHLKTENIDLFFQKAEESSDIVLMIHLNPDGDTMGAALALRIVLDKLNKKVDIIAPNRFPSFLSWMHGSEKIIIATENFDLAKSKIKQADLIICLDFNSVTRIGNQLSGLLSDAKAYKVIIDHHLEPCNCFDMYFSKTNTSSTSEILFEIITKSKYKDLFDKEIAENIYVGIITDTGSFSYSCNNESTYNAVSYLMHYNIDGEAIHRMVYDTYSENRMRLLGLCLSERLVVLPEFSASYIFLSKADLSKYNYQTGDSEGVVNYGLSIEKINFTALFTERENKIRISFRSKGSFDVNTFARTHFNGGGHRNASGADSFDTLENTIKRFEDALILYKKELNF